MRHYVHAWLYRAYTLRETEHVVNPVHSKLQVPDGPPPTSQLKTTAYGKPWAVFFWEHQGTMDFGESFGGFSWVGTIEGGILESWDTRLIISSSH
jgi:hypothetical protein